MSCHFDTVYHGDDGSRMHLQTHIDHNAASTTPSTTASTLVLKVVGRTAIDAVASRRLHGKGLGGRQSRGRATIGKLVGSSRKRIATRLVQVANAAGSRATAVAATGARSGIGIRTLAASENGSALLSTIEGLLTSPFLRFLLNHKSLHGRRWRIRLGAAVGDTTSARLGVVGRLGRHASM